MCDVTLLMDTDSGPTSMNTYGWSLPGAPGGRDPGGIDPGPGGTDPGPGVFGLCWDMNE